MEMRELLGHVWSRMTSLWPEMFPYVINWALQLSNVAVSHTYNVCVGSPRSSVDFTSGAAVNQVIARSKVKQLIPDCFVNNYYTLLHQARTGEGFLGAGACYTFIASLNANTAGITDNWVLFFL